MVSMNISLDPFSRLGGMFAFLLIIVVTASSGHLDKEGYEGWEELRKEYEKQFNIVERDYLEPGPYRCVSCAERDLCQSELKPDLKSLVEFTVADKRELNLNEFKIVLKEGDNFNHILTPACDPKKFPKIFAEFREEGMEDWYEAKIYGISNHRRGKASLYQKRTEGKIRLKDIYGNDTIRELDYCKTYEIRLKINDVSGEEIMKAGPFKDKFTPEELLDLDEDASDNEKEITLKYEAIENGVKVSWDNVCAQSAKIYAKIGDEGMEYIKTVKDLSENSFTMKTKPCNSYSFEIDFFLSPDPDQKEYGMLYIGIKEFISPPEPNRKC